ncbi:hypothetical protein LTR27_009609 [Elasticomyces elasticus]|nr:hypothetical protein LTR27_009609 [Elasticomyces elasticus]
MPKPYVYRKLDPEHQDIRLLEVLPDKYHKRLKVVIRPMSLHATYETISYAWGDPTPSARIAVSDGGLFSRKRYLLVPAETEAALKRVRLPDCSRVVWIDAVCINQANDDERGQQVAIMSEIYRSSNGNLIYLGDEDGLVESAVANMNSIYEEMRLRTNDLTTLRNILYYPGGTIRQSEKSLNVWLDLGAFLDLIGRPWFSRLWVLQEACLAPANRCYAGRHEFDLLLVLRVAAWLEHHWTWLPTNLTSSNGFRQVLSLFDYADHQHGFFSTTTSRRTSYNLLVDSSLRQTSDPRDRVFGMLGLLGQVPDSCRDSSHLMIPDYRKHVTEVQRDATRYAILEDNALNILALVNHHSEASLGIISDTVLEIGAVFTPEVFDNVETLERTLRIVEEFTSRRTTISTEGMFRVLVASIGARGEQLTDSEAQQMAATWETCKNSGSPVLEELRVHIATFTWDRCVFATAKGVLGLGPAMTAAGDLVAVLDGGALPHVLRPEKSSYRFVGACYVHGIMHGTVVQGGEEGQQQIFDLR